MNENLAQVLLNASEYEILIHKVRITKDINTVFNKNEYFIHFNSPYRQLMHQKDLIAHFLDNVPILYLYKTFLMEKREDYPLK